MKLQYQTDRINSCRSNSTADRQAVVAGYGQKDFMFGETGLGSQRRFGGSGKRLVIAKNLVQRHAGYILYAQLEEVFRRRIEISKLQILIQQDYCSAQVFQSSKMFISHKHIIPG